ncbi:hypothetical protein MTO96_050928 [Rhipicephalus appendiculatus]
MSFDLGFDFAQAGNASAVEAFFEHVDALFDLVMVVERLNESHSFCFATCFAGRWTTSSCSRSTLGRFSLSTQPVYQRPPSGALAADLRSLNAVDVKLYQYFARRFDERVQSFGRERMRTELRLLENRTEYWYQGMRCSR